jgi:ABC-2 type transport system ATP-binding protein
MSIRRVSDHLPKVLEQQPENDVALAFGPAPMSGLVVEDGAAGRPGAFPRPCSAAFLCRWRCSSRTGRSNGADKTTTIKMLTTLLKPTSGKMELDGLDPASQPNEVRKRFGIVFQDPSLDDELTAQENMEIHGALYNVPRQIRAGRIEKLLKLFELWDRRLEPAKRFSGGMRRRLEIARSLLHTPRILFLDEPTLGLDPQTRNQLWLQVKRLNEEERVTVFLTTHYMEEAERVAHRVFIIDGGRIIAQGSPQELKQQTSSETLEQAFLALTGSTIREEEASSADRMRQIAKAWRR